MPAVILEVSTLSHIPAFVPFGVLYYTQDTGSVYIGTGSSSPPNVELVSSGGGGTPGGFNGDIQYNNLGAFGGSAATIDASGNIANALSVSDSAGDILQFDHVHKTVAVSALNSATLKAGQATLVLGDSSDNPVFNLNSGNNVSVSCDTPGNVLNLVAEKVNVTATTLNVSAGIQVASLATAGNYLRGNGTNFVSSAIQSADVPTLNQNTSGTASNLSGTPALPNGTSATTQSQADGSTKLATTAYVDTGLGTKQATLTGTGIARNSGACTELSGDVTTSGSNVSTVGKINGGAIPASAIVVGTNSSRQIVDATSATLSNNTSGTAANLSGTPALPNGTSATTQSQADNSTKLATTAYVDTGIATKQTVFGNQNANLVLAGPTSGAAAAPTFRALAGSDFPINTGTGTFLPPYLGAGTPGEGLSVFGTANKQQGIKFTCPVSITLSTVAVNVGTGVAGALMGIALYDATGTTKMTAADGFSVDTGHTGIQAPALSTQVTLRAGTSYWVHWTATTNATLTVDNILLSVTYCSLANNGGVTVGNSNNSTTNGVTGNTIGTMSNAQERVLLMYFY